MPAVPGGPMGLSVFLHVPCVPRVQHGRVRWSPNVFSGPLSLDLTGLCPTNREISLLFGNVFPPWMVRRLKGRISISGFSGCETISLTATAPVGPRSREEGWHAVWLLGVRQDYRGVWQSHLQEPGNRSASPSQEVAGCLQEIPQPHA